MKKEYIAPEIELVRFESEEVLNVFLPSGVGSESSAGDFDFDENTDSKVDDLFN